MHSGTFVAHKSDFVGADCKMSLFGSSNKPGFNAFHSFGILTGHLTGCSGADLDNSPTEAKIAKRLIILKKLFTQNSNQNTPFCLQTILNLQAFHASSGDGPGFLFSDFRYPVFFVRFNAWLLSFREKTMEKLPRVERRNTCP